MIEPGGKEIFRENPLSHKGGGKRVAQSFRGCCAGRKREESEVFLSRRVYCHYALGKWISIECAVYAVAHTRIRGRKSRIRREIGGARVVQNSISRVCRWHDVDGGDTF